MLPYWKGCCVFVVVLLLTAFSISALSCGQNWFRCASGSECVLEKFVCDADPDCGDGSDESNCTKRTCLDSEHTCGNGRCILKNWICDNFPDCDDASDESICNRNSTCPPGQFQCYNGLCLSGAIRCDRENDCLNGEDEKDCVYNATCNSGYFQCKNKKCVAESFQCDGDNDCGDKSDEENCGKTCKPDSFTCKSGECIRKNLLCNGKKDCADGSDEGQCPTVAAPPKCYSDEFLCDGQCVLNFKRCDGDDDCLDGTDEVGCDKITCPSRSQLCGDNKTCIMTYKFCDGKVNCPDGSDERDELCVKTTASAITTTDLPCKVDEYKCKSGGKCISKNKLCDQKQDCPDNDDEASCSVINKCLVNNGNCSQLCFKMSKSFYCSCKHGYRLMNDSRSCEDINECEVLGMCSQTCTNMNGSYKCSCIKGYVLSPDGKRCLAQSGEKPNLLVAVGMDVRSVSFDGSRLKCVAGKNSKNVVAVAMHHKHNRIIWADVFFGKIFSAKINQDGKDARVVLVTTHSVQGLSVDWVTETLYWMSTTSRGSTVIEVVRLDGSHRKTLNTTITGRAHSIVVDPVRGYLYWTNPSTPSISRAYMSGEQSEDIVTTHLISPTGLTIDFANEKLFWLDSKLHRMESSDLDGHSRRTVLTDGIQHPFAIAVFGETVYWSDPFSKTVTSANKFTGKDRRVVIGRENITSYIPKGISIQHPLSQPAVFNRCEKNGECSHLCLLVPRGFRCACPDNGVLRSDGKTCEMTSSSTTVQPTGRPTGNPTSTLSSRPSESPATRPTSAPTSRPTTRPTSRSSSSSTGSPSARPTSRATGGTTSESRTTPTSKSFESPTSSFAVPTPLSPEVAKRNGESKGVSPHIIGGIVGGVMLVLIVLVVFILCRKRNNSSKMEIHYNSQLGVKILSNDVKNPTQGKKDINRETYLKFANQNFKEVDVHDDDDDDDYDMDIGERQPVFKSQEEDSLVEQMV